MEKGWESLKREWGGGPRRGSVVGVSEEGVGWESLKRECGGGL